jgi:pilus assembly protein CpaB
MTRRILGIIAASILALAGTVALVAFVAGAEERALEGEQLVEVYVVSQPVPSGTPASEIEELVTVEEVPAKVRPIDAVDSLPELANRVAAVDLQPGEQLIDSRFVEVSAFTDREVGVEVPDDMIELTIEMDPQRAIGGLLEPGQTVAVFASFEPFDITSTLVDLNGEIVALPESVADDAEGETPNTTNIILRKALVTAVQEDAGGGSFGSDEGGENERLNTAPGSELLVTLALSPSDAERLIFTAEFGFIWLAIERDTVPEADDSIKTRGNVYIDEDGSQEDGDFVILGPSTSEDDDTDGDGDTDAEGGGATDTDADTADEQAAGR